MLYRTPALALVTTLAVAGNALAEATVDISDETARINYSLGHQIGSDFQRQGIDLNAPAMVKGIEDAVSGAEPLMPADEMQSTLIELKGKIIAAQKKKASEQAQQALEGGKKFLEENAKQAGVVTTASGLQYQILEEGSGKAPSATDQVTVNYRGTQVDGKEFDSSYKRGKPATFPLNGVVKGWTEGLQLIKEGGKIKLFIPPELAYGARGPLANQTLIFDVELISVGEPESEQALKADDTQTEESKH